MLRSLVTTLVVRMMNGVSSAIIHVCGVDNKQAEGEVKVITKLGFEYGVPNFKEGLLQMWKSYAHPAALFFTAYRSHICFLVGHIAENCTSEQRLCYNCRQPGHESSACPAPRTFSGKQCYSCGGVGHIQAECPNLRVQQASGSGKCYTCGRFGHFARNCTSGPAGVAGSAFASRAPPPGRALNTSTLPPVKCYRCGGPNHMARDCLAAPGTTVNDSIAGVSSNVNKSKTCYKCQQEGHVRCIVVSFHNQLTQHHRLHGNVLKTEILVAKLTSVLGFQRPNMIIASVETPFSFQPSERI
ncbi:hypothetical protein EYR40_005603 [Pleurotus pulmonarius]|nr:hypothetical protein EYR40_005603 [Pleurotus pulmonarius]